MRCIHLGKQVGTAIQQCCGGTDVSFALVECHGRSEGMAVENLTGPSHAVVEIDGARQMRHIAGCERCPDKVINVSQPMPIELAPSVKPKGAAARKWEELRRRRMPPDDVKQVVTINIDTHGYGDAITAAWIAEGSRLSRRKLRLCASGDKADLLRLLGQEVIGPDGGCAHFDTAGPEYAHQQAVGAPPVAVFRARRLGISDYPARPHVAVPDGVLSWAPHTDVLLYPQCTQTSRTWPHEHWVALYAAIKAAGYRVRVSGLPDSRWAFCDDWMPSLTWTQHAALMRHTKVVVGNDSAPMHLAGTLNRPAIALLGRTTDSVFSLYPTVKCLSASRQSVPCAGCWSGWGYSREVCEQRCAALASISERSVLANIEAMISPPSHPEIAIVTAVWGDYWRRFGHDFIGSMESMSPRPAEVIVVADEPLDCPSWFRRITPEPSSAKMWDWINDGVRASRSEWIILAGVDDTYFPNALEDVNLRGDAVSISMRENGVIKSSLGAHHWEHELLKESDAGCWNPTICRRDVFLRYPWRRVVNPDWIQLLEMRNGNIDIHFDPRPRFEHRVHTGSHSSQPSEEGALQVLQMKRWLQCSKVIPGPEWLPRITELEL
jgi:hypothetical protein